MKKIELIENYLDELFSNPKCEINYTKDYELLIAIMLSAQTTDKRVNEVTKELWKKYSSLKELSEGSIDDIKKILRPLGNYNKKSLYTKEIARIIHEEYNDITPKKRRDLECMPGIGRKTVNVFFSELNIEPNIAVDTHVERVAKRLDLSKESDKVLEVEKHLRRIYKKEKWNKRHLQMVLFGRYKCKAINPDCSSCKLKSICRRVYGR